MGKCLDRKTRARFYPKIKKEWVSSFNEKGESSLIGSM